MPTLVFLQDGIPEEYTGDLTSSASLLDWLTAEVNADEVELIGLGMLKKIVKTGNSLAVVFSLTENHGIPGIDKIHALCKNLDVPIVQIVGSEGPKRLGIDTLPGLVYYESRVPAVFEGDLSHTDTVIDWVMEQRTADTIEEVTEEILRGLVLEVEYVAVVFTGPCDEAAKNTECEEILEELETIDDEVDGYGIVFVTTEDIKYAGNQLKIRSFPALGIFRNGNFMQYTGSLYEAASVFSWLVDKETIEIPGRIEEVGRTMLARILEDERDVLCFFYEDEEARALNGIFKVLETIDDELEGNDVEFVKCSDEEIEEEYALDKLPALVYFENKIPIEFDGNLNDGTDTLSWILEELEGSMSAQGTFRTQCAQN